MFDTFILLLALGGCSSIQPQGYIYVITSAGSDTQIVKIEAVTGTTVAVYNTKYRETDIIRRNDSLFVVTMDEGSTHFFTLDPETSEMSEFPDSAIKEDYARGIDRSGDWSVFVEDDKVMWRPQRGTDPVTVSAHDEVAADPDISVSNGLIAYSSNREGKGDSAIIVKSLPDGKIRAVFDTKNDDIKPSISGDGFWIVFQSGVENEPKVCMASIQQGNRREICPGRKPVWFTK